MINDALPPAGGAETYLAGIMEALTPEHEVSLLHFGGEDKEEGRVRALAGAGGLKSKFGTNPRVMRAVKDYVARVKPDLIHLHNNHLHSLSVLEALDPSLPIVQTVHDYGLICPSGWMRYKDTGHLCEGVPGVEAKCRTHCLSSAHYLGSRWRNKSRLALTQKKVRLFLAPSAALKGHLERQGFTNVEVLPYFIDAAAWSCAQDQKDPYFALFVGTVTKNKGVEVLIHAVKQIIKEIPEFQLWLIGKGVEKFVLQRLARTLYLTNHLHFKGWRDTESLKGLYQKASVTIIPSIWKEQFGIVGLESMASGTPVIGSRIGGIPEWLEDGKTGILVEPKDHQALAEQVVALLKDPGRVKTLGQNGRRAVEERFAKGPHLQRLTAFYQKLL